MRPLIALAVLLVTLIAGSVLISNQEVRATPPVDQTKRLQAEVADAGGEKAGAPAAEPARAGLTFEKTRIEITAAPDAKQVTVPYTFENKTDRTITIARYDSACSCLSAKVKGGKLEYKPGEKGELKVDFALGSFSGLVEKTVLLWTAEDGEETPSSVLTVALTIPVLFEVTPKTVFWDQNGGKQAKVVKLKVNNSQPIRILNHSGTNDNFSYELKTIRDGWEYELVVSPKDVSLPAFGMIKLSTDSSIPRYQRQMAFVCIKRQAEEAATPPAP
ncbi:MAG: DUF1573 domain-containing protein [Akkermansiaceae bacterium]|nr:DUF1573 domain-containing protein [Akkermansiaceae bacterium]